MIKKVFSNYFLLIIFLAVSYHNSNAQLRVSDQIGPQDLVKKYFAGGCANISNISYKGYPSAIGYFNGSSSNIGMTEGVILTSGLISIAPGPNNSPSAGFNNNQVGDADLDGIISGTTFDASVLEFDFISFKDTVSFEYVFASEEYEEYVGSQYNDVFAFFVSGPGISGKKNIALIPGTSTPVSINNVNQNINTQYYKNNDFGMTVQYDGFTTVLKAQLAVTPCTTYHMKIAIADVADHIYDSGVFLKAGSFNSGFSVSLTPTRDAAEGACNPGIITINRNGPRTLPQIVKYTISGSATNGVDYQGLSGTITIPAGQSSVELFINAYKDSVIDPDETVTITVDNICSCASNSVTINIAEIQPLKVSATKDTSICIGDIITLSAGAQGGGRKYGFSWSGGLGSDSTIQVRPTSSTMYIVTVTDSIYGCTVSDTVQVNVSAPPIAHAGSDVMLCKGTKATIGAPATGGKAPYQYTWNPPDGLSDPNIATPIAQPLSSTIYIVTVTSANGCTDEDTVDVGVSDLTLNAGDDITICDGTSTEIGNEADGGKGPFVYLWTPSTGLNSPRVARPTAKPTSTTKYIVTVMDAYGCSAIDTVTVIVVPQPTVTITPGGSTTICEDSSVTLYATIGFKSYTWSNGDTTRSTTVNRTGQYTVTAINSSGCEASANISITVLPKPIPVIGAFGPVQFCRGDSVILDAGSDYNSFLWSTGEKTRRIVVKQSGNYTVTVTNSYGCKGTSQPVNVSIRPYPIVSISGPSSVCQNSEAVYYYLLPSGHSYLWSVIGGTMLANGSESTIRVLWGTSGTGTVKLRLTVDSSGCFVDTVLSVRISSSLLPTISANKTSFCQGDSVRLDAGTGYTTYLWSNGLKTQAIVVKQSGKYWVEVKDANGCTGRSPEIPITMNPLPSPIITASGSTTFCEGDSVTLDAGSGYKKYQWNTGSMNRTITVSQTGSYIVTVIDTNGCSGTSQPIDVIVNKKPLAAISGPRSLCKNSSASYFVQTISNGLYNWNIVNGSITSGNGTNTITVQWNTQNGTVEITVIDNSSGCTSNSKVSVIIGASLKPVITASGSQTLCEGANVTLDAGAGYSKYQWNNGSPTQSINVSQGGSYFVTVTDANGCSGTSDSIVVSLVPKPIPSINGPTSVCINSTDDYSVQSKSGYSYSWSVNNGTILSGVQTNKITVRWGSAGIGTVRLQQTIDSISCTGDTTINVTISSSLNPTITTNKSPNFCEGDSVILTAQSGYSLYQWNNVLGPIVGSTTQSINIKQSGSYTVTVTDASGCTGTSQPVVVTVNKNPTPAITASGPTSFCEGDSVILRAPSGFSIYQWNNVLGPIVGSMNQSVTIKQAGSYFVAVMDANNCTGISNQVQVIVFPLPTVTITQNGNLLTSTSTFTTYQWNFNNTPIPGATQQSHTAILSGDYTVTVVDQNGCKATSAPVQIENAITTTISLPFVEAEPGEKVVIPITISSSQHLNESAINDFITSIRLNKSILLPTGSTPAGVIQGRERIITISGNRTDTIGVIGNLEFIAALTNVESTTLRIEQFDWSDNRIRVTTQDGEFKMKICREGGARLVRTEGKLFLQQNRPNPYNAATMIEYEIIEKGHTQLFVMNLLGKKLATIVDADLEPGRYEVYFDANALSSGTYVYVLQTPSQALYKLMEVVK